MKSVFTALDPNGVEHKRTSKTRTYTHTVVFRLAGDGFDGGDFAGMNPDYFKRARDWADAQLERREVAK